MNFKFISIFYIILSILCNAENPKVLLETSQGNVTLELNQEKAPLTVKNFISYVEKKFYDNTVFHRVIDDFMIQGGGFSNEDPPAQKKPESPIKNEGKKSGLSNIRGSIAMARTNDPDSATSQFFINVVDNSKGLDPGGYSPEGYAVFGKVIKGMDVVDKIKKVKTGTSRLKTLSGVGAMRDVPVDKVIIKTAKVIKSK
ncbi:MAG: peptidylprolyl isomerase [Verrucomicrobiales bacterium]|nr:peptidylprolyl isomerase [Verrucomicrobiota bacterium]MEC8659682.1 peptidylprolyl isomerase [Verrucomicrobiota bacterium]|tara:strand:- start:5253 stop:5849 length:597 start_codon:yes stop_codon:yes gene_type:complete